MLIVDSFYDAGEAGARLIFPRFERETHAYDFQRVGKEHARHARQAPAHESPYRRLLILARNHDISDLLVRHKLDRRVGEYS